MWRWALFAALGFLPFADGQGRGMTPAEVPIGMRSWLGRDACGEPRWHEFHAELSGAIASGNSGDVSGALAQLGGLLGSVLVDPWVALDCGTAVASGLQVAAQCAESLQMPLLGARLRQVASIFGSFDYQMKGEEYINSSPWPINWMDGMQGIIKSMVHLKAHERAAEPWRSLSLREAIAQQRQMRSRSVRTAPSRKRVAIVSVCDYDPGQTPLARLSRINKGRYAEKHGYDVIIYEKAPLFEDPLTPLLQESPEQRPPAWSKVDAILTTLADGRHDWVLWMDCDSFFMDSEVSMEDIAGMAEDKCTDTSSNDEDLGDLRELVRRWQTGAPDGAESAEDLLAWYDALLDEEWKKRRAQSSVCGARDAVPRPPSNTTLGWDDWLFDETRPQLIASEDGLMLNTGIVLVRASTWSWHFFQKVRWMTFGRSPVTHHPWWEQTAMVYLLQVPFVIAHASETAGLDIGAPGGLSSAAFLLSQRHINSYPPIVASALYTHETYENGDFIISFSGCKIYSSQEVCNQLFLSYFAHTHGSREVEMDPVLAPWL